MVKARVDTVYYDKDNAECNEECIVKLAGKEIRVEYEDEDGQWITYEGEEISDGHYRLSCPRTNGSASLHTFPKGKILEGYWEEAGIRGFWRIHLK